MVSLDTILVPVTDMDRSVVFYRDVVGLHFGLISPGWSEAKIGAIKVGLHPPFGENGGTGGCVIGVSVADLMAFQARLKNHGAKFDELHEVPHGVVLSFRDPDGNSWQAIQRGITLADLTA